MVIAADAGLLLRRQPGRPRPRKLGFIVGSRSVKGPRTSPTAFHWNGDAFTDGHSLNRGRDR